jgi:hypothetical protein
MHNVYKHIHYIYPLGFNFHHPSTNHHAQRIMLFTAGEQLVDIYAMCAGFTGCERRGEAPVEDGGKHPIIYRGSTILLVMQDFFHPQYHHVIWGMATNKIREAEFQANITSKHGKKLAKG